MINGNWKGESGRTHQTPENPNFVAPITNVTSAVGREAILTCIVDELGIYKVAWLQVDTQTILTIQNHVITKNHRIAVTHSQHKTWFLHIKEVKASDRGWYMCQINTDPMKSQVGYLDIVVPPDILDYATSSDVIVREGAHVNLNCVADGTPIPVITWKRENGESISLASGKKVAVAEGPSLNLTRVNRREMGAYLCIASNGVPPSVSKRIMVVTHFPPNIWIKNQLVGAYEGQKVILECHSEAWPRSINYWTTENGIIISHKGVKYDIHQEIQSYKTYMKIIISSVSNSDYGKYKCVAKNQLGETDGTLQLFRIPKPSMLSKNGDSKGKTADSRLLQDVNYINSFSGNFRVLPLLFRLSVIVCLMM
ncbi:neurotrimin-like [Anthonomus grandis grandis]|uniref:neurotrimin-like n=1 Tax=Anthonomus grandis grandis TaxID=2921223 RepID=UPI002165C335|nr:neurotrimin-like [Anthonomus grandis grandis]